MAFTGAETVALGPAAKTMASFDSLTGGQFGSYALEMLQRKFDPDGLARFLRLVRSCTGDCAIWKRDVFGAGGRS